jgi:hypothetical protein
MPNLEVSFHLYSWDDLEQDASTMSTWCHVTLGDLDALWQKHFLLSAMFHVKQAYWPLTKLCFYAFVTCPPSLAIHVPKHWPLLLFVPPYMSVTLKPYMRNIFLCKGALCPLCTCNSKFTISLFSLVFLTLSPPQASVTLKNTTLSGNSDNVCNSDWNITNCIRHNFY